MKIANFPNIRFFPLKLCPDCEKHRRAFDASSGIQILVLFIITVCPKLLKESEK